MALSLVFSRGEPYRKHYETAISKSKKTIKKPMVSGYDFPLKPPGSSWHDRAFLEAVQLPVRYRGVGVSWQNLFFRCTWEIWRIRFRYFLILFDTFFQYFPYVSDIFRMFGYFCNIFQYLATHFQQKSETCPFSNMLWENQFPKPEIGLVPENLTGTAPGVSTGESPCSIPGIQLQNWLVVWLPWILFSQKYWVANHPNWRSYFSEGWPNHQPENVG